MCENISPKIAEPPRRVTGVHVVLQQQPEAWLLASWTDVIVTSSSSCATTARCVERHLLYFIKA